MEKPVKEPAPSYEVLQERLKAQEELLRIKYELLAEKERTIEILLKFHHIDI